MLKALFAELPSVITHRGWPRTFADPGTWRAMGEALREGKLDLLGEWGDVGVVHAALYEPATRRVQLASLDAQFEPLSRSGGLKRPDNGETRNW